MTINADYTRANEILDKTKIILDNIKNHQKYKMILSNNKKKIYEINEIDEIIEMLLTKKTIYYRDLADNED